MDGEIEELEKPDNPGGPNLFRFVMFKGTEKVSHSKKLETDKAKMMPMILISLLMMWTRAGQ